MCLLSLLAMNCVRNCLPKSSKLARKPNYRLPNHPLTIPLRVNQKAQHFIIQVDLQDNFGGRGTAKVAMLYNILLSRISTNYVVPTHFTISSYLSMRSQRLSCILFFFFPHCLVGYFRLVTPHHFLVMVLAYISFRSFVSVLQGFILSLQSFHLQSHLLQSFLNLHEPPLHTFIHLLSHRCCFRSSSYLS